MDSVRIGRASFGSSGNNEAAGRTGTNQQTLAATYDAATANPVRYQPTDRSAATVGPMYPGSQKPVSTKPDGAMALLDPPIPNAGPHAAASVRSIGITSIADQSVQQSTYSSQP